MTIDKASFVLDLLLAFVIGACLTLLILKPKITTISLYVKDMADQYEKIKTDYTNTLDKVDKILDIKNARIKLQEKIISKLMYKD